MSPAELYAGQDGSLFKTIRLLQTPFFRYERLSQNEFEELTHLLCNDNAKGKSKAGPFREEPTPEDDARTDTDTNGGDYLH